MEEGENVWIRSANSEKRCCERKNGTNGIVFIRMLIDLCNFVINLAYGIQWFLWLVEKFENGVFFGDFSFFVLVLLVL